MTDKIIMTELLQLPESMKLEVLHFVQFLKQQQKKSDSKLRAKRQAGILKGKIWIAPDFDAPLEDFKEYM